MARILVVEDDVSVRHSLVRVLVNAGYEATATASGADGLRLYRENGADLVLTDILMPEMSGTELIRQLKDLAPRLPVIAMSAGERARDFEQLGDAHAVGAIGLLRKPFTRDELLAVVAAALEKPAQGEIDRPVRT